MVIFHNPTLPWFASAPDGTASSAAIVAQKASLEIRMNSSPLS
jgi:hypothetical protein